MYWNVVSNSVFQETVSLQFFAYHTPLHISYLIYSFFIKQQRGMEQRKIPGFQPRINWIKSILITKLNQFRNICKQNCIKKSESIMLFPQKTELFPFLLAALGCSVKNKKFPKSRASIFIKEIQVIYGIPFLLNWQSN